MPFEKDLKALGSPQEEERGFQLTPITIGIALAALGAVAAIVYFVFLRKPQQQLQ